MDIELRNGVDAEVLVFDLPGIAAPKNLRQAPGAAGPNDALMRMTAIARLSASDMRASPALGGRLDCLSARYC